MFWVIRWTDAQTDRDRAIVIEADSRAEAEYMGLKRGIPIVLLAHATRSDIAAARRARLLWRFSPAARYTFFGQPLNGRQVAALILAGFATAMLHLGHLVPTLIS
jgi:hypothetical protein